MRPSQNLTFSHPPCLEALRGRCHIGTLGAALGGLVGPVCGASSSKPAWLSLLLVPGPQVRARQLWGSAAYTEDSDLVAVLYHLGYVQASQLPGSVAEVRAVLSVLELLDSYPCASRNGMRSRAWGSRTQGCSYKVRAPPCTLPRDLIPACAWGARRAKGLLEGLIQES